MGTIINLIDMGRVDDAIRIYNTLGSGSKMISFYYIIQELLLKFEIIVPVSNHHMVLNFL